MALGLAVFLAAVLWLGARALQAEMTKAFRETFPGPQAIVDIPLQMRGKVKELQDKLVLFGLDQTRTPLASDRLRRQGGGLGIGV